MSYCTYIESLAADTQDPNKAYHDHEYGFPIADDKTLFGRLLLEINQAGLNWTLMLRKKAAFEAAYDGFDPARVAAYGEAERQRLLADARIVRNRLKINAAIHNAQAVLALQKEYGSLKAWLDTHHPKTLDEWTRLFKRHFKFVGGEIVHEFLMSCGYLPGAHDASCPIYPRVLAAQPPWARHLATCTQQNPS
ncbi:MAG: DNA-3-methyladenine glycosylase I [Burkholderiaceae bacterium]|jgi:DNA-3-methyladenine glycosylase I|nr:DNA-3-methyladenine glycosylase I [Burkholderiaceae bacterium]